MRRLSIPALLVVALCAGASSPVSADVRSDQRIKFQLAGMLGKMINMFSKGAREGVTTTVAVKGDRKAMMSGDSMGQIIDLTEEKIYDLDLKKKTYKVTTFAELRKQMEEARKQAEQAREQRDEASKTTEKDPDQKEFEVDYDVKNTAETRAINGFDTKKTVITVTVREKGKTLNDGGGMVMTTDLWIAAGAPSTKDLADFERKYAEKLYGPAVSGASAQDMAMAMTMYPQMKPALERMQKEAAKLPPGTAILTDMRMEAVPPGTANQSAEALPPPEEPKKKGGLGGMLGGLKKMAEQAEKNQNSQQKPQRTIFLTTSVEMLKLTTDVDAASVAIPTGFTEKK